MNPKPNAKKDTTRTSDPCRCGDEKPVVGTIRCRRVNAAYTPEEHATCPYCFGRVADILTGDHTRFCDYKPGVDPINFGFPTDHGRYAH